MSPVTPEERLQQRGYLWVAEEVAVKHGLTVLAVVGRGRRQSQRLARRELYWRLYTLPERRLSLSDIAWLMCRLDHGTILAGVKAYQAELPPSAAEAHAVEGALQRARAVRQDAVRVLAADLRRIEAALPELGLTSLGDLRAAGDSIVTVPSKSSESQEN